MHLSTCVLAPLLLATLPFARGWGSSSSNPRKILLSDVSSLTLTAGKMTSHRRVPAIPQLRCVSSPSICNIHTVDVMRCVNAGAGYDDEDIQWTCTATLPEELKLGRTDVICEGYSGPDDPYVLKGSCGVEYTMHLTDKGRDRHPDLDDGSSGSTWAGILFAVVFVGILLWIVGSAVSQCLRNRQQQNTRPDRPRRVGGGGGFWGGGGGGDGPGGWGPGWGPGGGDNDPPPPYSGPKPPGNSQQQQGQQGWRPGFWSGLAGGAAAGYLAGQRGQRDDWGGYQNRPWGRDRDRYDYGGHRNYGSTWGRSGSRSSEGSSTGAAHESTGFGSTSRR